MYACTVGNIIFFVLNNFSIIILSIHYKDKYITHNMCICNIKTEINI